MIVIGLLTVGFVGYQLWGTGIETARTQQQLENRFERLINPQTTTPTPTSTTLDSSSLPSESATSDTTTSPTSTPTSTAGSQGSLVAKMEMPTLDKVVYVVSGIGVEQLQKGPGHFPTTPLPGELGNSAIAGHRTTWGEPFGDIDRLDTGDEIILTMLDGATFVYNVTSSKIVRPVDSWVIATTDPDVAMLTLTTCHPKYTTKQRLIVHALLNVAKSDPVRDSVAASPTTTTPAPPTTTLPAGTTTVPSEITGSLTDSEGVGGSVATDPFNAGWFRDRRALPQITLWALALIGLAFVARRRPGMPIRRAVVGYAICVAPFAVALYFLYQNINRLLPAGL